MKLVTAMKIGMLGASGNVGRLVVRNVLSYGSDVVRQVVLVNRRLIEDGMFPSGDSRLVQHVVDMSSSDALEKACVPLLQGVDVVVSTMGVGSGKGSVELFRKIEVELPSAFARAAKMTGVSRAVMLTGVGSDINSTSSWMVGGAAEGKFFHLKGLVEKNFSDLTFAGGLAIFRPAGLLGTSHAPAFFDWLLPKIDWMAPVRFRSIHIQKLACAMASVVVDATKMATTVGSVTTQGGSRTNVRIFEGQNLFALLSGSRFSGLDSPRTRLTNTHGI
jgi:hypothetical protein